MTLNVNTNSGNGTGIAIAVETSLKVAGNVWFNIPRVDSYSGFKRNRTVVEDDSISTSYQATKSRQTGHDAEGGFTVPMQPEMIRYAPGFMFADATEYFDTLPINGVANPCTAVSATTGYDMTTALPASLVTNDILFAANFATPSLNGVKVVLAVTSDKVTVDGGTVAEAGVPSDASLQRVGHEFTSGDLGLVVVGDVVTITSSTKDLTELGLVVGQWIFVGGDLALNQFATGYGYLRVSAVSTNLIQFDDVAWIGTLATDTGTAKLVRMFISVYCRYEDLEANQTCTSYNVRRLIGPDANGMMSEYLEGAFINSVKLNGSLDAKHTMEMGFMALTKTTRDGTTGVKAGTVLDLYDAEREPMVTPSDVFRIKLSILPTNDHENAASLFTYASEFSFDITNNITVIRAVNSGTGIDISRGMAGISGTVTPFIKDDAVIQAVNSDATMSFNAILANANRGVIYDMPHLGANDDGVTVAKDEAIKITVAMNGAMNKHGYSFATASFDFLPNIAMPV